MALTQGLGCEIDNDPEPRAKGSFVFLCLFVIKLYVVLILYVNMSHQYQLLVDDHI